jgi:hypothetical protein
MYILFQRSVSFSSLVPATNSLESHLRRRSDCALLVGPALDVAVRTLLIEQLRGLRHGHADELRLGVTSTLATLSSLASASTSEHLQSLHRCTRSKAVGIVLLTSAALLIQLLMT